MQLRPIILSTLLLVGWQPMASGAEVKFTPAPRSTAAIAPELPQAHAAIAERNFAAARQYLLKLIGREPFNTDALIALAALARQHGDQREASQWLRRAVNANPVDPEVLAAFLNAGGSDPMYAESRLKSLISSHPGSAAAHFALGNLYARQGRWPEAQPAYFQAVASASDNPDYLFNLAVSLDHLRQARPAARYYRQALSTAGQRPTAFEPNDARRRLAELEAD